MKEKEAKVLGRNQSRDHEDDKILRCLKERENDYQGRFEVSSVLYFRGEDQAPENRWT